MTKRIFTAVMAFMSLTIVNASVVINELMPKNVSSHVGPDFNFSGWAEFYNNGAEDVDLSLYFLSDELGTPLKWQIGQVSETDDEGETHIVSYPVILKAKEYKVIYFRENKSYDEAPFKLPAKKGALYLSDQSGMIVDKMAYDTTYRNVSYGRIIDGEEQLGYFTQPTPSAANATGSVATIKTEVPQFSLKAGFYSSNQQVSITAKEGARIYYTTDGSEPTPKSNVYSGNIEISKTTPIRAIAVVDGEMSSDVNTATYFINENINKLPIVSLNTNSELLFGDELGILVIGTNGAPVPGCSQKESYANYMADWDRPCNFEYFDNGKSERLNQEVKVGTFGACSRTKYIKSIKVNPGKIYGDNELDYPLFSEKPNLKWKSIVLRNAGNDYGRSYLRDGFIQTLMITGGMDLDHQAYQPSMVFINGEFYAMLNIRERTNKDFIFSNYGLDEDEFVINEGNWNNGGSNYGDLEKLAKSTDMNEAGIYEAIDEKIDINEFLNYFLAEIYCGNQDWPGGNIKAWRANKDGKWRWILYDTEYSYSVYGDSYSSSGLTKAGGHTLFKGFLKNNQIKERMLGKLSVHMATTFESKHVNHVLDSLIENITPDVERYINLIKPLGKIEQDFDVAISSMRKFADNRVKYMYRHIKSYFKTDTLPLRIHSDLASARYALNEEPINISDFNGYYYTSNYFTIEAKEPAGYKFDHWELTNDEGKKVIYDMAYRDTLKGGSTLKAFYVEDKDYNPAAPHLFFSEICASNTVYVDEFREAEDWFEIYNAGTEAFNLGGLFLSTTKENLGMYEIPSSEATKMDALSYKVFWADNDDEQGDLHTNFKLPIGTQNTLFLSSVKVSGTDSIFTIIDSVTYKTHKTNESFARFSYTALNPDWKITGKTTFGAKNIFALNVDDPVLYADEAIATIYPNPVVDQLYFSLPWEEEIKAAIVTPFGQMVDSFKVRNGESVQLQHLKKGLYILMMQTPKGKVAAKLIKE